jgi:hypothetical protein
MKKEILACVQRSAIYPFFAILYKAEEDAFVR